MDTEKSTSTGPEGQAKPTALDEARRAIELHGAHELLLALEERWSTPAFTGVTAELLRAARRWLDGDHTDPLVLAAYELVRAREEAEKAARVAA